MPKNAKNRPKTAQNRPKTAILAVWRFFKFSKSVFCQISRFCQQFFFEKMKNSKNCVNLVFWSFVAPPGLSPDQIGHSKQKTGTLSFDTPKYMKIPNSQSWIHPISCTSPQMGSHQKFHSLNKLISKIFFSKIKILTHPYKSYVTIKNMFSHQISHIIMYSPLFWVLGVTLLRLLRCTNMLHFASSKEHSARGCTQKFFFAINKKSTIFFRMPNLKVSTGLLIQIPNQLPNSIPYPKNTS